MNARKYFWFQRSFWEAAQTLSDADRLAFYDAIVGYALTREPPRVDGIVQALFPVVQHDLDFDWNKMLRRQQVRE